MDHPKHPYSSLENTDVWLTLEKAVKDLVDNNDLQELTDRKHIVGYLAKRLSEAGIAKN
jgi:hypothetical protein